MKGDAVVRGGSLEVGADIVAGDCNRGVEGMCGSECFDHGGRVLATLPAMAVLKFGHRPGEQTKVQHLDVIGKRDELCAKTFLLHRP